MGFTIQNLMGDRAVINGTDVNGNTGQVIVDTSQWDYLKTMRNFSSAKEDFDAAVEEFFAPLMEAAEKMHEAHLDKPSDPAEYVVLKPGVDAVEGTPAEIIELNHDSIILRLIEEDDTDRLVWIGENQLEVLAKS